MTTRAALLACLALATGCDVLDDVLDGVEPPESELLRVDLVTAPTTTNLLSWQCDELFGGVPGVCGTAGLGATPKEQDLVYSFDLVFDLFNPNPSIPIPLVEVLLGMNVFDTANLGAVCISFCDPAVEDCTAAADAEGACAVEEAQDVKGPEDFIPTVDELIGLTDTILAGELDNDDWRVLEGHTAMEAHFQFDMAADVMLDLADEILVDAVNDVIAGQAVQVEVPYTSEGTLFFNVPQMGRHAFGFGPWDDSWVLQ